MHGRRSGAHIKGMDDILRETVRTSYVEGRITEIRAAHVRGYRTESDEAHGTNPICAECDHAWPCDTALLGAFVAAEVSHRISPVVGWLRMDEARGNAPAPSRHERLMDTIDFFMQEHAS